MKTHRIAHLALIATATLLICSIVLSIVGYFIFLTDPRQGPFNGYRFREISMGLSPYLSLTAAFFAVWLSKSRGLQMILIVLYTLLGLFAIAAGIAAWSHTGNILTLIMFPVILIVSLPSFIILRKQ
jgi:hypothetical protein